MEIANLIGLIVALIALAWSIIAAGASFKAFYDLPSLICVGGGSIAAVFLCFPLKSVLSMPKVLKCVFLNKQPNMPNLIRTLVELAETARREGLLALEQKIQEIDNAFLVLGIQMAVDGTQAETIESIMRTEQEAVNNRHRDGKNLLDQTGKYGPAFGMIGTLLGLIIMLGNMNDPAAIGPGMAVALLTTLYGAVLSNVTMLPWAEKLNFYNKLEMQAMEITIRGVLAIQQGDNPRVIEQQLNCFVPPKQRSGSKEKAA